ncbi:MAG: DUF4174 domain-containing protein [Eudoraea sp.]|uniref:DUF4174 domain-containing protein n=1 Tax=Eudoraea sp. TaxID=1979955 RepID=UPI003C775496
MFNLRCIVLLLLMLQLNTMTSQDFREFKWKKRILLLIDTKNDLNTRNLQLSKFNARYNEMKERDLVLFVYNGKEVLDRDGMLTNINPDNLTYGEFQGIILIGKDGGVKFRKKYLVEANEVFDLIDQMPMRRAEMKNR